jgi:hypothetical protein
MLFLRGKRERKKRNPDELTLRECVAEFGERLNQAHEDRPRAPHALISPIPYDPGGFSSKRQAELDAELARQRQGEEGA